ncbi:MAG: VOC family protein [Myxococcota bacterium]
MLLTDPNAPRTTEPPRAFPLVLVSDLDALRAFYVDTLGCSVSFDLPRYLQVQLTASGGQGPEVCFMIEDGAEGARGVALSVPVANADDVEARLRDAGVSIAEPATDRPWGWRSLHVVDPAGLVLDLFHVLPTS